MSNCLSGLLANYLTISRAVQQSFIPFAVTNMPIRAYIPPNYYIKHVRSWLSKKDEIKDAIASTATTLPALIVLAVTWPKEKEKRKKSKKLKKKKIKKKQSWTAIGIYIREVTNEA